MKSLAELLTEAERRYELRNPASRDLYSTACRNLPDGTTRAVLYYNPFPLFIKSGKGAYLRDADAHEYLDLVGEYTSGVFGHTNEKITAEVRRVLANGFALGGLSEHESKLAHAISNRFSSCEQVRFCNSGSEANLIAIGLARRFTGRKRILVFRGGYHGGFFSFPGGVPTALNVPFEVVYSRYNSVEETRAVIKEHESELAAVIVEPVMGSAGCIPGSQAFLNMLREETQARDVLLIFDEVMSSRLAPGGAQEVYQIRPDLTTLGKYLGGGFAFGALGGSRELLSLFDMRQVGAVGQSGTFNNNVVSMAAGVIGLTEVFTVEACRQLNALGETLRQDLNARAQKVGAAVQATGLGSVINIHFSSRAIHSPEDVGDPASPIRRLFHLEMLERGYYTARRGLCSLSMPMTAADLKGFADSFEDFLMHHQDLLSVVEAIQ